MTALYAALRLGVTVVALMLFAICAPPHADAAPEPVSCKLGTYLESLGQVKLDQGTFDADFWMWSVCPNKEAEPLKTMEFTNAVKIDASLDSTFKVGKVWWASRKISGTFRQDFFLTNFPFDSQTLIIDGGEGVEDASTLVYAADDENSIAYPGIKLRGWNIREFRVVARLSVDPTNYGNPEATSKESTYANMQIQIRLERQGHALLNFLKATFAVYIAALLALASLLVSDGRMGLVAGTMFTLLLSFLRFDGIVGPHESFYMIDWIHFVGMALILVVGAWGIRSSRALASGQDKDLVHRRDKRVALGLLVVYAVVNIAIVAAAIHNAR